VLISLKIFEVVCLDIRKGLKLNGANQLWIYADYVNILHGSVHIIKKHTEALVFVSKEIGLEVNGDKTKYMAMCEIRLQDGVTV
jgi:hypothetical protein